MAKQYVRLCGSAFRYNLEGQTYEAGKVYSVPEARAEILVRKRDDYHRPYFAILTDSQVEELTGERVNREPAPAPAPKAPLEDIGETDAEAEQAARDEAQAAEDALLDSEPDITDDDVEVVGAPEKALEATLVEGDEEFTDI